MSERSNASNQIDATNPLRSEELAAHKTAVMGRTLALVVIAILVAFLSPWPGPLFTHALLLVFVLLGWASWGVAKSQWGKNWHQYVFVFADFALLTFTLLFPNPLVPFEYPAQFALRYGPFIYFFVLLSGLAYVYQPRLVLWGGVSAVTAWAIGVGWLINLPDTVWVQEEELSVESALALAAQRTFIDIDQRFQELAVFLIAASLLALAVKRSRAIALRQARLARERENLGRYFPRKTAQLLAERTDPFSRPNEHNAAVLFADLVAFTTWSEEHTPFETIDLLRDVHGMLADVVFRHNGTLDKFIGDGIMATFGTPDPSERAASDAVSAMVEMFETFERWKIDSTHGQRKTLKLAIGAHYGPVVIGNIGTRQRLEFAVLGDTVNVASRLETATRAVGCNCLASAALMTTAEAEMPHGTHGTRAKFTPLGPITVKGRHKTIDVYAL